MGIIGDHPESGVRFTLERPRDGGPPWEYAGEAATPDERFAIRARVDADGTVSVTVESEGAGDAPADVAEKARLMLRTLYKQAKADGDGAPPRKIVRWRGEK